MTDSITIIHDENVPDRTMYIGAHGLGTRFLDDAPLSITRSPWGPTPAGFTDYARAERLRAMDWLAAKIDEVWRRNGWDPQTWRRAREAEARAREDTFVYLAHERMALAINRPEPFAVVTGV